MSSILSAGSSLLPVASSLKLSRCRSPLFLGGLLVTLIGAPALVTANEPMVRFDVAAALAVSPIDPQALATSDQAVSLEPELEPGADYLSVPLEFSTLVTSPTGPRVEQLLVEVDFQDSQLVVADYSPRTRAESRYAGDIAVEQCEEDTKHLGFNAVGTYPPLSKVDLGGDVGGKRTESIKYQQLAPVEILAAAGTSHRRRGVFFKFRATPTQVLEGDKMTRIIVRSPRHWRGGLMVVRMRALTLHKLLPGTAPEAVTIADEQFVVALHRADDVDARSAAGRYRTAVDDLRRVVDRSAKDIRKRSMPTLFHEVAAKLDLAEPAIPKDWLRRAQLGELDPHGDPSLRRLPVDVRVALLDYQAARDGFLSTMSAEAQQLVSK